MLSLSSWAVIPLAFFLDMALGDPETWPHPVRLMGRAVKRLEKPFRGLPFPAVASGALFTACLVGGTYLLVLALVFLAGAAHPVFRTLLEIVVVYYCLAVRSLDRAALEVEEGLRAFDLERARLKLGLIVGRKTANLNGDAVGRGAIETVAENFVDGVLSPLFFAVLGGAPLAAAFKMASTLDSMVGYRNERYEEFGKASARLDDVLNFLPARISMPVIALAARGLFRTGGRSLKQARREGGKSASPNAGRPEAAFSGALGVCLAGPSVYGGKRVEKPWIGERFPQPKTRDLARARALLVLSSLLSAAFGSLALLILGG